MNRRASVRDLIYDSAMRPLTHFRHYHPIDAYKKVETLFFRLFFAAENRKGVDDSRERQVTSHRFSRLKGKGGGHEYPLKRGVTSLG